MTSTSRPTIAVTADTAVFTVRAGTPQVVLVERANEPYRGMLALPGGFVEVDEDLPEAAVRELAEETGLRVPAESLTQLGAYGAPGRDPRMRVITVVYWVEVDELPDPVPGSDAAASRLVAVSDALRADLAFDHREILGDAWEQARR